MIVPPSWIVKVPRKGSFKSSLKTSPNKKKKKAAKKVEKIEEGGDGQVTFKNIFILICVEC